MFKSVGSSHPRNPISLVYQIILVQLPFPLNLDIVNDDLVQTLCVPGAYTSEHGACGIGTLKPYFQDRSFFKEQYKDDMYLVDVGVSTDFVRLNPIFVVPLRLVSPVHDQPNVSACHKSRRPSVNRGGQGTPSVAIGLSTSGELFYRMQRAAHYLQLKYFWSLYRTSDEQGTKSKLA